jgi:hypothetical protein
LRTTDGKTNFLIAVAVPAGVQRQDDMAEQYAVDADLRAEVESFLWYHQRSGAFSVSGPVERNLTVNGYD